MGTCTPAMFTVAAAAPLGSRAIDGAVFWAASMQALYHDLRVRLGY